MNNVNELWSKRFKEYNNETKRYLKYMLNDHLKFVLIFAIGGGAYYYQQWLATLSSSFRGEWIIALLLGLIVTRSPIATFFKQPDLVFLLPMEEKLKTYFRKSATASFVLQLYSIIIGVAVLSPLYMKMTGNSFNAILLLFVLLLVIKALNMSMQWSSNYFQEPSSRWVDLIVRFMLNMAFIYLFVLNAYPLFIVAVGVLLVALTAYYRALTKKKPLPWEQLIELEERRVRFFYRMANMFTDVPHVKERVKRRKYLDVFLSNIPFAASASYRYLYTRSFLRAGDYLGLFLRLSVIGIALGWFIPFLYGKIIVTILFVYLTGFQLMTMWKQYDLKLWTRLYPVSSDVRLRSFLQLLKGILLLQTVVLSLVLLFTNVMAAIITLVIGVLFSIVFVNTYVKRRVQFK
ncbi:ABC transporter permease [Priestia koreensis]|uniref:ABC transporter permease n=1 Tax=Priestia koreensis TaxID=284581 RepID=UPI00203D02F8|nr:ABC transporter permease [Priestia koreensis]MCM3004761.1 ABC transporter permease [Priestia koreensis]